MKQQALKALTQFNKFATKNSPTILTAMGVGGLVTTTVLAIKATPKAMRLLEEARYDKYTPPIHYVKICWREYVPTVIMATMSIACIIGANSVNLRRQAALASMYSIASTNLKDYQGKVVELLGDKKDTQVRDAVAKKRIEDNPVGSSNIIRTGKGDTLCFDSHTGRYFTQDLENLRRAENAINRMLLENGAVLLNDFYYEIGLSEIKTKHDLGWEDEGLLSLRFSSQLTEKNEPCVVIDWAVMPSFL